jgi:hypothetical protein
MTPPSSIGSTGALRRERARPSRRSPEAAERMKFKGFDLGRIAHD